MCTLLSGACIHFCRCIAVYVRPLPPAPRKCWRCYLFAAVVEEQHRKAARDAAGQLGNYLSLTENTAEAIF